MQQATAPAKPADGATKRRQVQAARESGDFEAALVLIAQAAAAQPRAAWPRLERIAVLRESGQLDAARALVDQLLADEPKEPRLWVQLGHLERSEGRHEAALAAFAQARTLDPKAADAVVLMAQESFALGRQAESDTLLAEALVLDRDGVQALTLAAQRAMQRSDADAALAMFETAIARCPWHVASYVGATNALIKLGRVDAAMAMLDRAIEATGSRPALHTRRAQLLREMGHYQQAADLAEQALERHPESFALWECAMRLKILLGDEAEMRAFAARARPQRVADQAALAATLGDMEAELGDPRAAIAQYQRGAELAPGAARMQGGLAIAHLTSFAIEEAFACLQRQTALLAPSLRLKSRSDNPTQSYYGQILNEYRLDPQIAAAIGSLPEVPAARIEPLRALCRAHPGNTLAAAALVDAVCRAGLAEAQGAGAAADDAPTADPGAAESPIPRRIAQYWDAARPPADIASILRSWAEQNPDFRHTVFDDLGARAFLEKFHPRAVLEAYHRAQAPAMKADLFRLAFLASSGGVYADADDRCLRPIERFLPAGCDLVLYREYLGTIGNNFLAAAPAHPVILAALDGAIGAILRGDQDILWLATGPGLITRCLAAGLADPHAGQQLLARTRIWPRRQMLRHVAIHCLAGYKESAQHWIRAAFTTAEAG